MKRVFVYNMFLILWLCFEVVLLRGSSEVSSTYSLSSTSEAITNFFLITQSGGQGTFYMIPTSESPSGSCNLPTAQPAGSPLNFYASVAMNYQQFMGSAVCGACLEVTSPGPFIGFGSWPTPPSKVFVHVTNDCPTCPHNGSLDFGFPQQGQGVWPITWKAVSCQIPFSVPIQLFFMGSSIWYLQVQARSANFPYQGISLLYNGQWLALVRVSYGFFELPQQNITLPLTYPMKFQIISITGEIVNATVNNIVNEEPIYADGQFTIDPTGASIVNASSSQKNKLLYIVISIIDILFVWSVLSINIV